MSASRPAEEQASLLRAATAGKLDSIQFRPQQVRFLSLPQTPICYWLRDRFFELLAACTLGDRADVCQGLATARDPRFVRFHWEVRPSEWARPLTERRWVPFEKGGGYGKWYGHHYWAVEWEHGGARIKSTPGPRVQNEQHYFREGWTYSYMARGSFGLRRLDEGSIFAHISSAVLPRTDQPGLAAQMNSRISSFLVRALAARIQLTESYIWRLPAPEKIPPSLVALEAACISVKHHLVGRDITERSFTTLRVAENVASIAEADRKLTDAREAEAAVLHALEGEAEREACAAYVLSEQDLAPVIEETGTPAAWFPLVVGYDALPPLSEPLVSDEALLSTLAAQERRILLASELVAVKQRLRLLYDAGAGATLEPNDSEESPEGNDEEDEEASVAGASIPIPSETFLEEVSRKMELHPVSIYWLLREVREEVGEVNVGERRQFAENCASECVLRLVGHKWPKEIASGVPTPDWVDEDGIIPLTEGLDEPTLLARLRALWSLDFGETGVGASERYCHEMLGKPVADWLAAGFWSRHTSQFKKRPIAWQIESRPTSTGNRGRGRRRGTPVFSCLVYYHRLDADLLPKIRTQYVGPLRVRFQTELGALERTQNRSAEQDARRVELDQKVEELSAFDARLKDVVANGFACTALQGLTEAEPLDKWTSRDGRAGAPSSRQDLLAQERRYDPDINDGVRVNIAPLQRAGLLAADVLAAKDVEKAISDRAEWRADERRWCREGKLPRPGWWLADEAEAQPSAKRPTAKKTSSAEDRT